MLNPDDIHQKKNMGQGQDNIADHHTLEMGGGRGLQAGLKYIAGQKKGGEEYYYLNYLAFHTDNSIRCFSAFFPVWPWTN